MIWFKTDKAGRWPELENKLDLYDLDYKGKKVPENDVEDHIRTMHAKCLKAGAPPFPCPTKPLTYTALIKVLKEKGLVSSFPSERSAVALEHQEQVSKNLTLYKTFKCACLGKIFDGVCRIWVS